MAKSMNEASPTCCQRIWMDSRNVISSPASVDGRLPFDWPDGPMTGPSGPAPVPASRSRAPGKVVAAQTSDICGLNFSGSLTSVGPPSSSASKSPRRLDSDGLVEKVRTCRLCRIEKPYAQFYVNSRGNRRQTCIACVCALERTRKRGEPHTVALRHHEWRRKNRGAALVNVARYRARIRQLPFALDAADIQRRIEKGCCELTGIAFDLTSPRSWNAPSLDQIRPGAGYTQDNVRVVLYSLNVMANVWGTDKITQIASAITNQRRARSASLQTALTARLKATLSLEHPLFSLTWKERVTPSGRRISALRASARSTSGKGFGSWPTPNAREREETPEQWTERNERQKAANPNLHERQFMLNTAAQLAGWPSPMAGTPSTEMYNAAGSTDYERKIDVLMGTRETVNGPKLAGWPTPIVNDELGSEYCYGPKKADGTRQQFLKLPGAATLAGWPSPNTPSGGRSVSIETMDATGRTLDGRKHTASLEHAVKFAGWPSPMAGTPSTEDYNAAGSTDYERKIDVLMGTRETVNGPKLAGWPTARAEDSESTGAHRGTPDTLTSASRLASWTSPQAADANGSGINQHTASLCKQARTSGLAPSGSPAATAKRGQLNPAFSRWLQGYPASWCQAAIRAWRKRTRARKRG
jgi:hypothetical protein